MRWHQRAADRLSRGTTALVRGAAAWVRAAGSRPGSVVRLCLLLGGAYLAWRMVRAVPSLLWLITGLWMRAAWRSAPTTEAADEPPAEPDVEAVRELLRDLVGDRTGVHLSTALAHLQERGHGMGWTVGDLRTRLGALGVPVRRSVKVDKRVTWGVHREDLTAPSPAVVDETAA
ncbi:hypothetical protein [Streptomyces flavidovirens]|uniref:hypothetical protein n=1 Tax=Streptomyces flavidovirens TaxID=67298 RepID=UPI000688EFCB|nr:hypothetical protein [Streptomyces flavidovirens]